MSGEEDISQSESEGDFSASEDEWVPHKNKVSVTSESDSDFEVSIINNPKLQKTRSKSKSSAGKSKPSSSKAVPTRKAPTVLSASERKKLVAKYKNTGKVADSESDDERLPVNKSVSTVLDKSKVKKKPILTREAAAPNSDSESSGDDYMVDPNQLDLNSDFFKPVEVEAGGEQPPNFDCNVGVSLSDSESNDEDSKEKPNTANKPAASTNVSLIQKINSKSSSTVDFHKMTAVTKQLEQDKQHLINYKSKENVDFDISELLAMGEPNQVSAQPTASEVVAKQMINAKKKKKRKDSEDDWEEVEEDEHTSAHLAGRPTQDVEIRLDLSADMRKRSTKDVDLEACLKRKLNRIKKEHQVSLHKVNVLCWIAHGNYVNNICNHPALMAKMLQMIPSTKCYPADKTTLNYFDQIVKWYTLIMCLAKENGDAMYSSIKQRPKLPMSLSLQMGQKKAICKRDYVLMFVVLLRALGIQCRMVMSLNTLPLRPAQHELCKISVKKADDNQKEEKSASKKKTPKIVVDSPNEDSSKSRPRRSSAGSSVKTELTASRARSKSTEAKKERSSKSPPKKPSTRARSKSAEKATTSKSTANTEESSSVVKGESSEKKPEPRKIRKRSKSAEQSTKPKSNGVVSTPEPRTIRKRLKSTEITQKSSSAAKSDNSQLKPATRTTRKRSKSAEKATKKSLTTKTESLKSESEPKATRSQSARKQSSRSQSTDNTPKANTLSRMTRSRSKTPVQNGDGSQPKVSGKLRLLAVPQLDGGDDLKKRTPKLANLKRKTDTENGKEALSSKVTVSARTPFADSTELKNKNQAASSGGEKVLSPVKTRSRRNEVPVNVPAKKGETKKRKLSNPDDLQNPKPTSSQSTTEKEAKKPNLAKLRTPKQSSEPSSSSSSKKPRKRSQKSGNASSDEDFLPKKLKMPTPPARSGAKSKAKDIDTRVLSTDVDDDDDSGSDKKRKQGMDLWVEVYSEIDKKWFSIDLFRKDGKVNCVDHICRQASRPIIYVFAWHNDKTIKDISARYCTNFNTTVRKMRAEREWLDKALVPFKGKKTERDKIEDRDLDKLQYDKPMPTSISEFKDHPLYALGRHLLKFQAIYPPNPPPLGYVRNEPIYARECVYTLHSREIWLKQARTVKLNEKPYKVVMARPKWDRLTGKVIKDIPLEIFGIWQTQQYDPPTAENGIVPRNAYGNVELFKACMLPKKTVHLQLPGLNKTCRKLNVDCAAAVVGFDFHGGWSHPVYDGFVICEEFVDQVVDAWNRDQEEQERKEREKYESRVYGNWKRLIKGLFIRKRLQTKYNFGKEEDEKPLEVEKVPMVPADMAKAKKRSKK